MNQKPWYKIFKGLSLFLLFLVIILNLLNTLFVKTIVTGNSMHPHIKNHAIGYSNRMPVMLGMFRRFDIVVIKRDTDEVPMIKRIVGLPGDTVQYVNDDLFINGKRVKESFLDKKVIEKHRLKGKSFTTSFGPIDLSKHEYYVLGDNRPISFDSRHFGPISKEHIQSVGWYRATIVE